MLSSLKGTGLRCPARQAAPRAPRELVVSPAAMFGFLAPAKGAGTRRGRKDEIVDELIELTERTNAGLKASPALKERVEELVRRCGGSAGACRDWRRQGQTQSSQLTGHTDPPLAPLPPSSRWTSWRGSARARR